MKKKGGRQEAFIALKINNKEEKNRKYLIGWGHIVDPIYDEKRQEISVEPRAGSPFGDRLTGYTAFLVKWSIYRDRKVILILVC